MTRGFVSAKKAPKPARLLWERTSRQIRGKGACRLTKDMVDSLRVPLGPHGAEGRAKFDREGRWLLPSGEVSAFVGPIVVNELRIGLLGPALRRLVNLIGESADGDGDLQAPDVKEAALRNPRGVPVKTRRGDCRVREPIDRDIVEHVVRGQAFLLPVEGPGDHPVAADVVIEHPGGKADRRVDQSV